MARSKSVGIVLILLLSLAMALAGCASPQDVSTDDVQTVEPSAADTPELSTESTPVAVEPTEITVLAAASLTEAFTEMAESFESTHEGIKVLLSFAGSQECVAQIQSGVTADIFASANTKYMDNMVEESYVDASVPVIFANNKLVVVCNKNVDPAPDFADLAEKDLLLVIADETVPVGKYTLTMLSNVTEAGTLLGFTENFLGKVVSKETNVKLVLSKVEMGEADCGIVYTSDAVSADPDAVYTVDVPDEYNVVATYPIAPLAASEKQEAAQSFIDYILSEEGSAILLKYGLLKPE